MKLKLNTTDNKKLGTTKCQRVSQILHRFYYACVYSLYLVVVSFGLISTSIQVRAEVIESQIENSAQTIEGHIQISDARAVAYEYTPAVDGRPTIVLLNGLIYPLKNWHKYVAELTKQGYGVVLIAYSTQSESLRKTPAVPYFARLEATVSGLEQAGLEISDLAADVISVVDHLEIDKFHLQTLSFGSIPGSYIANNFPERLESVTLIAPAVMPAHRYTPYGESRHNFYVWQNQINLNPFYVPDYYYDLELRQTMTLLLAAQYSSFDLRGISYNHFFGGVYEMARSTKYYDLKDHADKDWPPTNVILASDEDPSLKRDQMNYWYEKFQNAPDSRLVEILDVPHEIPGSNPETLAQVTLGLLANTYAPGAHKFQSELSQTQHFDTLGSISSAGAVSRSCNSYLKPKTTFGSTFGTF